MDLTPTQWQLLEPLLPPTRNLGRPWLEPRRVLNGVLWVLRTGLPWRHLPNRYPSFQTCHRRYSGWVASGVMDQIYQALNTDLYHRGGVAFPACCEDGTFTLRRTSWGLHCSVTPRLLGTWQHYTTMIFIQIPFREQERSPFAIYFHRYRQNGRLLKLTWGL